MLQLLTNNVVVFFFYGMWVSFLELRKGVLNNLVYCLTSCLLEISAVAEERSFLRVLDQSILETQQTF